MPNSVPIKADHGGLMLMLGELTAAAKAANDGLKSLGEEVRTNASATITAAKTMETIEATVNHLNELIRDSSNPQNLATAVNELKGVTRLLSANYDLLKTAFDVLEADVQELKTERRISAQTFTWGRALVLGGAGLFAWLVTTLIAILAVLKDK